MNASVEPRFSLQMLGGISETLLIPLIARASAHRRFPHLRFRDVYSELILQALDVNASRLRQNGGTLLGSCLRARWVEHEAATFMRTQPDALGVSLGAGLDTLYLRLCDGIGELNNDWYDVDLPAVIALKRNLLTETNRYRMLAANLSDPQFIDTLRWRPGQPAVFVLEGVLMFMERAAVEALLKRIIAAAAWRGSTLSILFDYCSPFMARQSRLHPSVHEARTAGADQKQFRWSLERPEELQWLHPELHEHASYDLMRDCGVFPRMLGWVHQRLTGRPFYGCVHMRLQAA